MTLIIMNACKLEIIMNACKLDLSKSISILLEPHLESSLENVSEAGLPILNKDARQV